MSFSPYYYLSFSLFSFVILFQCVVCIDFTNTKMCDGNMLCTLDCSNCNLCDATTCSIANNCFCPSKKIPGNIPLSQTPQFFTFTFDDSVHETTAFSLMNILNNWLNDPLIVDKANCSLRPTMFAMNHFSDFAYISYLDKIGEVSIHSTTHTSSFATSYNKWKNELTTCYNDIAELAQIIPKGSRAPYLEYNDDYFRVLKELNVAYDYSSVYYAVNYSTTDTLNYWPFTLDFGYPEASIGSTAGVLNKRVPGIWEFPMTGFQYPDGSQYEIMDYTISDTILSDFQRDFDLNYNSNRAPFGLYFHSSYFMTNDLTGDNQEVIQLYAQILRWVASHGNVIFTTPQRIINWMKNPKPFLQTVVLSDFKCPAKTITPSNPCNSGVTKKTCTITGLPWYTCQDQCPSGSFSFNICGSQCPNKLPDIDVNWAYLGTGKTRNYLAPTQYFDITTPESNSNYYNFPGIVTIANPYSGVFDPNTLTIGGNGQFCSKIVITNPSSSEGANGFILSIDGCSVNSNLLSNDGYPVQKYTYNSNGGLLAGFRMIGKNVQFMRNADTTVGRFCMQVDINTFTLDSLLAGVDLYTQTLRCNLGGTTTPCAIFCGNKQVDSGEDSNNCPIDVNNRLCPSRRLLFLQRAGLY